MNKMMENKIYIRITQATDTEGRMPYKFFADAIVPNHYVIVDKHKNINGEYYYLLSLSDFGKTWFKAKFNKNWDGYFSLYDTKYNPGNPLEQYYEELKKAEDRVTYLNSLI